MFKDGSAKIYCNFSEKKGTVLIKLLYHSLDQLNFEREHIFEFLYHNMEFAVVGLLPGNDQEKKIKDIKFNITSSSPNIKMPQKKAMNPLGKSFFLKINQDSIQSNFSNPSLFAKAISSDRSLRNMKEAGSLLDKIIFKTTFITSKEIKEYHGHVENISPDKKSITFKSTLGEIFNKPKSTEFLVTF